MVNHRGGHWWLLVMVVVVGCCWRCWWWEDKPNVLFVCYLWCQIEHRICRESTWPSTDCLMINYYWLVICILVIHIAQGWTSKCETCETRIKCLRKNPKHLTLTHTHYTHTTTISVQEFGAFDIETYHLCLKSWLFHFIMGFMNLISSVVLRLYKWLDTLGVMYKSSMERSLSFWDFGFKF